MALLERDVQFFVGTPSTSTHKMLLLSGYTFNQDVNISKTVRSGLSPTFSRAYRGTYVNHIIRASASLTHYLTPFSIGNCAERPLWAGLLGNSAGISMVGNACTISTTQSNLKSLQKGTMWFKYPQNTYRLDNTVIEEVDIDFGVEDFPKATWTLSADSYSNIGEFTPTHTDATAKKCIIGKLNTVELTVNSVVYNLGIVSGELKISNSINYTGRKRVGKVSQYLGHYTGTRVIEGNISIYLHTAGIQLIDYLISQKSNLEDSLASLTIRLGGPSSPNIVISLPRVILNTPDTSYDRILSTTLNFTALESSVGAADELTITYNT